MFMAHFECLKYASYRKWMVVIALCGKHGGHRVIQQNDGRLTEQEKKCAVCGKTYNRLPTCMAAIVSVFFVCNHVTFHPNEQMTSNQTTCGRFFSYQNGCSKKN
jgi:hypothetical protein